MLAASVAAIALGVLLRLFVSYCRSLLATCTTRELSKPAREVTGIVNRGVCGDEFERLFQLARLCPPRRGDEVRIRAVRTYYAMLDVLHAASRPLLPRLVNWAERERQSCAYFAAVTLDRRMAYTRELFAELTAHRRH